LATHTHARAAQIAANFTAFKDARSTEASKLMAEMDPSAAQRASFKLQLCQSLGKLSAVNSTESQLVKKELRNEANEKKAAAKKNKKARGKAVTAVKKEQTAAAKAKVKKAAAHAKVKAKAAPKSKPPAKKRRAKRKADGSSSESSSEASDLPSSNDDEDEKSEALPVDSSSSDDDRPLKATTAESPDFALSELKRGEVVCWGGAAAPTSKRPEIYLGVLDKVGKQEATGQYLEPLLVGQNVGKWARSYRVSKQGDQRGAFLFKVDVRNGGKKTDTIHPSMVVAVPSWLVEGIETEQWEEDAVLTDVEWNVLVENVEECHE
jgi:hypothetical protein